jgi:hypothetical protein
MISFVETPLGLMPSMVMTAVASPPIALIFPIISMVHFIN